MKYVGTFGGIAEHLGALTTLAISESQWQHARATENIQKALEAFASNRAHLGMPESCTWTHLGILENVRAPGGM